MQIYDELAGKRRPPHRWMLFAAIFLTFLFVTSVQGNSIGDKEKHDRVIAMYNEYKKNYPDVEDISAEAALPLLNDSDVVFVDVRSSQEQKVSMIPGAVTKENFSRNIEQYRDKQIIAYCTVSYRSGKFAEKMNKQGISVTNLQAGLLGWVHAHGPLASDNEPVNVLHVYGRAWELTPSWISAVY